jgi:hypothetical protein
MDEWYPWTQNCPAMRGIHKERVQIFLSLDTNREREDRQPRIGHGTNQSPSWVRSNGDTPASS